MSEPKITVGMGCRGVTPLERGLDCLWWAGEAIKHPKVHKALRKTHPCGWRDADSMAAGNVQRLVELVVDLLNDEPDAMQNLTEWLES